MTGILARIEPPATDRVRVNDLLAGLTLEATGDFTSQQVLDAINLRVNTALAGAELTDLSNIQTELGNQVGVDAKALYARKVWAVLIAVEAGSLTNEATARSILNIA